MVDALLECGGLTPLCLLLIDVIGGAEGDRTPDLMTASLKLLVLLSFPQY